MYCLSEKQIDFILADIRARGVEMETLQHDLLDHVCCIIEQDLEANGNFEDFYFNTIQTFYRKELKEIEEETLILLTNKNYYAMKKTMLASGAFSAIVLSFGILFKFMHWEGAAVLIVSGIVLFSLLFLPLLFTLKVKENAQSPNAFILGTGTLSGICFSLCVLFKLMHWPGANILGISAIGMMLLLFLPVYFFTGIRNAETKMNSIVTAILIVAGSGLLMSLVRSPGGTTQYNQLNTNYYLRNEQILQHEQKQVETLLKTEPAQAASHAQSRQITQLCQELKNYIISRDTGQNLSSTELETNKVLLTDGWVRDYFNDEEPGAEKLKNLREMVTAYNKNNANKPGFAAIPVEASVLDKSEERVTGALNGLTQIQMLVLQNERELPVVK
jgi:hypothetical protein